MQNPFNELITLYDIELEYAIHQKVIYNFEVYASLTNNNINLPRTGNIAVDAYMSASLGRIVGNTWQRL